jgi:uncharacterized protein (DUF305 family)
MKQLLLVLVFLGIAFLDTAFAQMDNMNMGEMSMPMQSMAALEQLSGQDFDIAYMSQMIEHHKGAIEMAEAALAVSENEKIRTAAQVIVDTQTAEITQLTDWLMTWYNVAPDQAQMDMMRSDMQPMMEQAMMGMTPMAGMAMPVDRSFLEGMIPHHQDAVSMSQLCLEKTENAELKAFCQGVIDVQTQEIAQYQAWLEELP